MPNPSSPKLVRTLDCVAEATGKITSWLVFGMMLITCLVVVLRYGFNIGSTAMQESVVYLHGAIFLLGMAYTLKHDGQVRVDIFYRTFSPYHQAWVNSLGALLFTLPFAGLIIGTSFGFVESSWSIFEKSPEAGGIPAIYLLKTLIPVGAGLLALQAVCEILRSIPVLLGLAEPPTADDQPHTTDHL